MIVESTKIYCFGHFLVQNFNYFLKTLIIIVTSNETISELMGESHIDFRTQSLIMTLASGEVIANDVLKMRKVIEFQSLYPVTAYLRR